MAQLGGTFFFFGDFPIWGNFHIPAGSIFVQQQRRLEIGYYYIYILDNIGYWISFMPHILKKSMQEVKRLRGYNVTTQRRLAEGGFGLVDLVVESCSQQEMVLKRCFLTRSESYTTANKEIIKKCLEP